MLLQKLLHNAKDILFPVYCLACNTEGSFVCEKCFQTLDCSGVFYCPICHATSDNGQVCITCDAALDRHVAVTKYEEGKLIGKILHTFKYEYAEDVLVVIRDMTEQFLTDYTFDIDSIIPIPLHKRRYVERGFNQAEKIACLVSQRIGKPLHNVLVRTRHTKKQAQLNRAERLNNLHNAFDMKTGEDIKNKRILLVDDVLTTGSTMEECARVLKQYGVTEVVGFTIARG